MWPVTLRELEGHSSVSELFKCKLSTFCAALYKISTGMPVSCSPSATAGFLFLDTVYIHIYCIC